MERVLSASQGLIQLGDGAICREMVSDIAKETVNHSSSARCHICKHGYTGYDS
jgi:hypothetical protein